MNRRSAERWAAAAGPDASDPPTLEVLIPTCDRPAELAVTLAGLAAQDDPDFGVLISDQSTGEASYEHPATDAMCRVLQAQGRPVRRERHLPARGLAEQRHFLLSQATAAYVLFLDDDVWLEPGSLARMLAAIRAGGAGFVGSAVQGLSYLDDDRPHEREPLELWDGPVQPEHMRRDGPGSERWTLHNAANLVHAAADLGLGPDEWRLYKVAWVGACVLFDRAKLEACGGFGFWRDLPSGHAGEDVAAQWAVMERYGGAGILPSGAVHLESPTTVPDRSVDAADLLGS